MNIIKLLLAFAPWIIFSLIAGQSFFSLEIAIIISLVITLVLGYKQMHKKYILPWATFLFFILSFIVIILMKYSQVAPYMGILSYVTLTAVTWGSILIGHPFTIQYAKEEVDKTIWNNPTFIRSNQIITAFWGVIFLINLGLNYYKFNHRDVNGLIFLVAGWILIIIGLVFTTEYTKYVRKRRQEQEHDIQG
jgi:hypothetical protein